MFSKFGCKDHFEAFASFGCGTGICLIVGFVAGLFGLFLRLDEDYSWPTGEMRARMESKALLPVLSQTKMKTPKNITPRSVCSQKRADV